jgi:hypothetical protein
LEQSRAYYLKGLHLLLNTLAAGEVGEFPDFVPRVELFVGLLGESALPLATRGRLMQHYERAGEFGKAEDRLYSMLESGADQAAVMDFGIAFYERLQRQSDASLDAGNLPRAELDAGLAELRGKRPSIR